MTTRYTISSSNSHSIGNLWTCLESIMAPKMPSLLWRMGWAKSEEAYQALGAEHQRRHPSAPAIRRDNHGHVFAGHHDAPLAHGPHRHLSFGRLELHIVRQVTELGLVARTLAGRGIGQVVPLAERRRCIARRHGLGGSTQPFLKFGMPLHRSHVGQLARD